MTMNLLRLSEVRGTLVIIASQPMRPRVLRALREALKDLKDLREHWAVPPPPPRKEPKSIVIDICPDHPEIVPVIVREEPEVEAILPPPVRTPVSITQRARSVSTSVTYSPELVLPYKVLWAKVIIRATYDYALWKDSPDIRLRRFAEDAARWLFEPSDPELDLSFENICAAFDFPTEKIRKKTRTLTREDVKKLEFRERERRSEIEELPDGDSR
jgi:hypothetical protein